MTAAASHASGTSLAASDLSARCVTIGGVQQSLVAEAVEPGSKPPLPIDGEARRFAGHPSRAQAQSQSFLDQASQARPLLRGQGLGLASPTTTLALGWHSLVRR